jgi:hypothetical protein
MQRKLLIFLGFAALTATGFFREYLFLNINEQIRVTYYQVNDTHVDPPLKVLAQFSYGELYYGKWLLTMVFAGIMATLTALIVKWWFRKKELVRIGLLVYGVVFSLSFVFFLIHAFFPKLEGSYAISRFLVGMTETPLLSVLLVAAFTLVNKQEYIRDTNKS